MSAPEPVGRGRGPAASVVVPTRDRAERLAALLDSLGRQTLPSDRFEVVVVDDGSSDDTRELLARIAGEAPYPLRAIDGRASGPAAARNAGWRAAEGRLVAFTDDDCEPDPAWLATVVAAANARPGSIIQGRTRPIPREAPLLGPLARTKWIDGPGPWYQTCNIAYPRDLLERLDGFDESFRRPFGEDADLAWRALEGGATAHFEPGALVHHAVEPLGPIEFLRSALRDPDEALIFKRHAGLRRSVRRLGIFKGDRHAFLYLAAVAFVARRWNPAWTTLAVPYLVLLALRCRRGLPDLRAVPWLVAHDAVELVQAARGAARHRAPLL